MHPGCVKLSPTWEAWKANCHLPRTMETGRWANTAVTFFASSKLVGLGLSRLKSNRKSSPIVYDGQQKGQKTRCFFEELFGPAKNIKKISKNIIFSCTCPSLNKCSLPSVGKVDTWTLQFPPDQIRQLASPKVAKRVVESTALALNPWTSKQNIQPSFLKTHQIQYKFQQKAKVHILSIKWSIRTI